MSDEDQSQQAVFAFLADPATHGGAKVTRIDTHAASVFLAGDRVLKVKRAVRFPFLDYSTLEKRKAACEAELSVNAPYAPEIYHGVVPIARDANGKFTIGGAGVPAEWAVDMQRFDETRTLDHLAGEIDEALADALGRAVAAAHAKTLVADAGNWIAALGGYVDEHVEVFRQYPDIFPAVEIDALGRASREAYQRIVPLLRERGQRGFVRHIHGDLHLGNIALIGDKPVLFDAIEFSDIIATGDVLYDLAFLLMDLLQRGLAFVANVVLNRYLTQTQRIEHLEALSTLPFFLSMRASIRATVTTARLERAKVSDRDSISRSARAYFNFARQAIAPPAPKFVAVGGLSGTGKTKLARALAPELKPMPGAVIVRSDVERKALFGIDEAEKLPTDGYTDEVTARVCSTLIDKARRVLAAGHSVIVDAVFAQAEERADIADAAESANFTLRGLFLTADLQTRLNRVGTRAHDASDADAEVAQAQERDDLGVLDWTEIDASGTPENTLARAKAALASA
jgi:aminoglycoside phosphotransferase family enzyme/predicted kinase